MKVSYVIQAVCAIIVFALLAYAIIFSKSVKVMAGEETGSEALYEELENVTSQEDLLASRAMQQARDLIKAGEYSKANDKLRFLINFYSGVSFADEAKQILGALNVDQIMSPGNPKHKTNYQIKRGDSLSRVASKHDSTVENIMELNGLFYANRIQPDQKLVVMSLNFRTVIDVSEKTLSLYDGQTFVTQYPLLDIVYSGRSKMITTKIDQTMAYEDGTMISRISSKYRPNKKANILKAGNLQIRPVKHPDEPEAGNGFFLSESDMEEYNLFVRKGNEVEIRL